MSPRHGTRPLPFSFWQRLRSTSGFVTSQISPPPQSVWSRVSRQWRNQLRGRPPAIALVLNESLPPHRCYEAYPDLDGVCDILFETVSHLKRDRFVSIAVNLGAEQIMINWTLCNRLQHMLSMGPSDFAADRKKVKASNTRDA